jgi:hypothetical protein
VDRVSDVPPDHSGYRRPALPSDDGPGAWTDAYRDPRDPRDPVGPPGRPADPSWPGLWDDGNGRGYRGQPVGHAGSQPPAGYGWHEAGYADQPPSGPPYGDRGYYGAGLGDPRANGPAGYPTAVAMPRRSAGALAGRGRRRALFAAAGLVLGVIGGAGYLLLGHDSGQTTARGGTTVPSQASPSPTPDATHRGDLRKYLVAVPRGSHPWPHPLGTQRELSLRQAASLSSNSKARRSALTQDHFTRGAVQSWITHRGTWADVRLYQFDSAADAQSFVRGDIAATSHTTAAADQSAVSGVPGARAFADAKPDSAGYVGILAIGVKGDVVFLADVAEHADTAHLAMPDMLMRRQFGRL